MVLERNEEVSALFRLTVSLNTELEKSLLEFGEEVKILPPKSLVSRLRSRLQAACRLYDE